MIDAITIETFRPHVGETFYVMLPGQSRDDAQLTITLLTADPAPGDDDPRRTRAPFSLIFRMPQGQHVAQGMYVLEREGLSTDIFLVPIVPDRDGPRIQAVFA